MEKTLLSYYSARAAGYEEIYRRPERQADLARLKDWLREQLRGKSVYEVACGTGYMTERIAGAASRVFACDLSEEVLAIARRKKVPVARVQFALADAYDPPAPPFPCDAAFAGFWWSHVPKSRLLEFLPGLHRRLQPGAKIVFFDNRFVEGRSTAISRTSEDGDTFQNRKLPDGRVFEILKNFPSHEELVKTVSPLADEVEVIELKYYWMLRYTLRQ